MPTAGITEIRYGINGLADVVLVKHPFDQVVATINAHALMAQNSLIHFLVSGAADVAFRESIIQAVAATQPAIIRSELHKQLPAAVADQVIRIAEGVAPDDPPEEPLPDAVQKRQKRR